MSSIEREAIDRASAEPMLDQVLAWSAVNSGSRNLGGLERMADLLADAFAALPGILRLERSRVEAVDGAGRTYDVQHGRNLHLTVRPTRRSSCSSPAIWIRSSAGITPSRDAWLEDGVLNGPGVADMKGGIAVMLAALKAVEASPLRRVGYEVVINSDEEVGSLGSAALIARQRGQARGADL